MNVELVDARQSSTDRDWLTNVYPFYLHDLSEFDDGYYRLSSDGRWEPNHLPSWLVDDTDSSLILRTPHGRVGFALVNAAPSPHVIPGANYRLAEFFVLRPFRRAGVGRRAAFALFDHLPGVWEVRELPRNSPAIAFWRAIISEYAAGQFEETMTHEEVRQTFDSRRRGAR
jgi:predicted acetyltransferase